MWSPVSLPSWRVPNPPRVLQSLRGRYRRPMADHAHHKLIRAAKKVLGVKIYYYDAPEDLVLRGSAPDDTIYDGGAIYVGPRSAKYNNSVLHDLVHFMVADVAGIAPFEFNYDASLDEETLTCEIEFWLGYHSSYYSYDDLVGYIREYNYAEQVTDVWWPHMPRSCVLDWVAVQEKSVRENRLAGLVAAQLGI